MRSARTSTQRASTVPPEPASGSHGANAAGARVLPVYLSFTTPHLPRQEHVVALVEALLRESDLEPRALGRSDWSFEAPLIPVRELMSACAGTVVVAMARTRVLEGVDQVGGPHETAFRDRYLSTAWTQIETAMAFQAGHPILVLREETVSPDGVLDPANSGLFVRLFSLDAHDAAIRADLEPVIPAFRRRVEAFALSSRPPPA